jgi:copper chaperone NosL
MSEIEHMKNLLHWRWLLLVTLVVLAACGGPATPAPAKIRFGETTCAECGMIISQAKYASSFAYAESEGRYKSLPFDDIGDMLAHLRTHPELIPAGVWVHDYDSEEWINAETAYFVESSAIKSPMGHGLAAFASKSAAEQFAAEIGGQFFDWDHLRIEMAMAEHHH